ncbi:tyrosinase cofactor [Streptomyces sp. NBC_00101]|uniref:tyrosinase family oxidase copper chaperone n=1 Tax=Streptomyces sp. NBC_00101 TaxID=2975651 RepID=UPI003246691A
MGSRTQVEGAGGEGRAATRRGVLRALFTVGTVAGTGAAWGPIVAPDRDAAAPAAAPRPGEITETYRGRRIRVLAAAAAPAAAGPGIRRASAASHPGVSIDGVPLHLMPRADGSYLSVVTHYESHPTPLAAARAAVDVLGAAGLSAAPHSISTEGQVEGVQPKEPA